MATIYPADRYHPADDLWVVSCFFNPASYQTKISNYLAFQEIMTRSQMNWIILECVFPGQEYRLPKIDHVQRIEAKDVMWQKERLLNIALKFLPDQCTKVAWIDCDLLFENSNWPLQTSSLLDCYSVVQLFDIGIHLPHGMNEYSGVGKIYESFGAVYARHPNAMMAANFNLHGHTGFAWAARRDLLEVHGLYDTCISGASDHIMAHGFCGDWDSTCVDRILGVDTKHRKHFNHWCTRMYPDVRARVGYTPGTVLHLWHGEMGNRKYAQRHQEQISLGFDPARDIQIGDAGCWEWAGDKTNLRQWAISYYQSRKEDIAV